MNKFEHPQRNSNSSQGPQQAQNHQKSPQEQNNYKGNNQYRSQYRENAPRSNYQNQNSSPKYNTRSRAEETIEDIKTDIERIEKEIQLELREIKSAKLGL